MTPDDSRPRAANADPSRTTDHIAVETPPETVVREKEDVARLEESVRARGAEGVSRYVLLRELGRGGMGVVYEARHVALNRVVALKMILDRGQASRIELARFLAEAEAVAAVRHDNVVQVYDYGESDGRPFMALEYCPGGTLARLLPRCPAQATDPRAMAALVARVARGVAAAHARGIVHRDLKPGNVFLGADDVPKVADFGLAKIGPGADVTRTGQGMGTPAYMAPEQARDARLVGPPADVWALGVILYEALTGTRPFVADDCLALTLKIGLDDPLPPRAVAPAVPRDLELICLHCLAKAPRERYPTATELADDLARYLRNEPIRVRPAGPLERAHKWVNRNKLVSGATAVVVLALSAGLGVALWYEGAAREQAAEAKKAAAREKDAAGLADREKRVAIEAQKAATKAENEVVQKNAALTRALVKVLVGPLAPSARAAGLSPPEQEAFWQVTALRPGAGARMFVEEASSTPYGCAQFAGRAEHALHAAVGLDPTARDAADRLLLARLSESNAPVVRTDLALAAARSGFASPETAHAAAAALADALARERGAAIRRELARGLAVLAARADSAEIAKMCATAADTLAAALVTERESRAAEDLAVGLVSVARRMDPAAAARTLTTTIVQCRNSYARLELARALADAAGRIDPAEGARACATAAKTLAVQPWKESDPTTRENVALALVTVTKHMDPVEAADLLARAIPKRANPTEQAELAEGLADAAARLTPGAAATVCAAPARALVAALAKPADDEYDRYELARGLAALVVHLRPEETAATCATAADTLAAALATTEFGHIDLASALTAVTERMRPADAVAALRAALAKATSPNARGGLSEGLAAAAARMDPAEGALLLTTALAKEGNARARGELAKGLGVLAPRLEPATAKLVCTAAARDLAAALAAAPAGTRGYELAALAEGFAAVAAWGTAAEVHTAARAVAAALAKEADARERRALAAVLAALAPRLAPAEANPMCTAATRALAAAYATAASKDRDALAEGLARVAPWADPAAAAVALTDALAREVSGYTRRKLATGLIAVATQTRAGDPQDRMCGAAVGAMVVPLSPLLALLTLHPSAAPGSSPQALVELLKHPFCVGEARRAVLDALALTYARPFRDQWEFVEHAQKHQPHLDLLTPPIRPEPKP